MGLKPANKLIPGSSGRYGTKSGQIWHYNKAGKIVFLKASPKSKKPNAPYVVRIPCEDGKYRTKSLARLMLELWGGEPLSNRHKALHRDGCSHNNSIDNLYWGIPKRGPVMHHRAKMNKERKKGIEARIRLQAFPPRGTLQEVNINWEKNYGRQIAKDFGVSPTTISNIKQNMPENNPSEETIQGIRERINMVAGGLNKDIAADYTVFTSIVVKIRSDMAEEKIIRENREF